MAIDIEIPHNFSPYPHQEPLTWAMRDADIVVNGRRGEGKKRAVIVYHRRGGKDITCWNILLEKALSRKGVYYYIFPSYAQARKAFWDNLTEDGKSYLDFIPAQLLDQKWLNEMKLRLINGSIIQILGSDNYDALRGTNPIGVVLSEYAYQNPLVWTAILDPILAKNKGWAIWNSTPQGKNHFYDLYEYAKSDPSWHASLFTIADTGLIEMTEIDRKRAQGVSEEMLRQEYLCSFEAGVIGAYYGKQLEQMEKEGRICYVPYDENRLVYTAWDLGFTDSMAIIFFQLKGTEIHIVDHYENNGYALSHYLNILREKKYAYGKHFAPHDGKAHSNTGTTFIQTARESGFDFTVLQNKYSILEGIEKVRAAMPRFFVDKNRCEYLIKCLLEYHAEWDDKAQVFRGRPKHSWASHSCFIGETRISTPHGEKAIKDIEVGEYVLTPTGQKKVLNKYKYSVKDLINIKFDNGEIICTKNHKIFSNNSLVYADALRYNDHLYSIGEAQEWQKKFGSNLEMGNLGFRESFLLVEMKNKSLKKTEDVNFVESSSELINIPHKQRVREAVELHWDTNVEVFDIEIENDHCYFAGGILVSNSDCLRYLVQALEFVGNTPGGMTKEKLKEMRDRHGY